MFKCGCTVHDVLHYKSADVTVGWTNGTAMAILRSAKHLEVITDSDVNVNNNYNISAY